MTYSKTFTVRWADMDPNVHMRHSAYTDYAAQVRLDFLADQAFPMRRFAELGIGPILFREDTRFLKEIHLSETIRVTAELGGLSADGSRWRIVHTIYKADGREAAVVAVDGAWLDLKLRKLTMPPAELTTTFTQMTRHASYTDIVREKK
ncbi:acyl-CoA thioesterase [Hymenobacter psychrotolerans]|uniref:Acyl-CoA thioester hydrolase n=1 Tax=Hymenobacter psychrotolerans DSM 18569 TaxID=1121959 RepID=A0A1M7E0P1_9BACT|nr:thioesterase family protein [Hymenobacter psychrotolerans]SHL85312.1 acyl-CoA thioester hydrolase [Hymenobacter psychrotolerans DSM 18569]